MCHNEAVAVERDVQLSSSSEPRDATSEAIEPVTRLAVSSFSKDAPMTGTATAENTTTPTGPAASTPAAKSKPQTIREFERSMRALGYSQREAAAIASHGFKAISTVDQAEDQAELAELAALIEKTISILKVSS